MRFLPILIHRYTQKYKTLVPKNTKPDCPRLRGETPFSDFSSVAKAFSFAEGASLEFVVPSGGYVEAPIKSANGITVAGLSSAMIDAAAFLAAGGQEQVLMDAGAGTISIDAASMEVLKTAGGGVLNAKLSDGGKRLVLSRTKGFVLIFR